MDTILNYSGIVTKIRAMEARLLSKEEYEKIAYMENVADFISFLKEKPDYQVLFAGREENSFHRNEIESLLCCSFYEAYAKIYRFCSQEQRKMLELVFWRMETDILKKALHRISGRKSNAQRLLCTEFLEKHCETKIEAIQQAESVEDFLAALQGSPYEKLFAGQEELSLSPVEAAKRLDVFCFTRIWKAIQKKFKGKDQENLKNIYGKQIDLLNILWLYRRKKYYGNTGAGEGTELIPVCYKLGRQELEELQGCYTIQEFFRILGTTFYSQISDESSVESFYKESLIHAYQEGERKYPYSMSTVYGLLYKKMREIDRLTTALECIRYQMDAGQKLQYVLQE